MGHDDASVDNLLPTFRRQSVGFIFEGRFVKEDI